MACHNKAVHQMVHTLYSQTHKIIHPYECMKSKPSMSIYNNVLAMKRRCPIPVPKWLLQCACSLTEFTCMAHPRINILSVFGAPNDSQSPWNPTPPNIIQCIEFTYCHDRISTTATRKKSNKYNPLNQTL